MQVTPSSASVNITKIPWARHLAPQLLQWSCSEDCVSLFLLRLSYFCCLSVSFIKSVPLSHPVPQFATSCSLSPSVLSTLYTLTWRQSENQPGLCHTSLHLVPLHSLASTLYILASLLTCHICSTWSPLELNLLGTMFSRLFHWQQLNPAVWQTGRSSHQSLDPLWL